MEGTARQISDSTILNLIRENRVTGWEHLYDKYGSVMYGIICSHTTDNLLAEEIFINLFKGLKQEKLLLKIYQPLCICVMQYTYVTIRKELTLRGINYTVSPFEANSILHTFCCQHITLKKVATNFNISKKEVTQNLHKEFLILRFKNDGNLPVQQQERSNENFLLTGNFKFL